MSIPTLLTSYLAAKAHHAEARRLMLRAERTLEKLARRPGGSDAAWGRACIVAGVELAEADHRSLGAYRDVVRARAALKTALRSAPLQTRLYVAGAVLCANLPARSRLRQLLGPTVELATEVAINDPARVAVVGVSGPPSCDQGRELGRKYRP